MLHLDANRLLQANHDHTLDSMTVAITFQPWTQYGYCTACCPLNNKHCTTDFFYYYLLRRALTGHPCVPQKRCGSHVGKNPQFLRRNAAQTTDFCRLSRDLAGENAQKFLPQPPKGIFRNQERAIGFLEFLLRKSAGRLYVFVKSVRAARIRHRMTK